MVGNWGARADRDGHEGISNPLANLSNQPVELIEADFPLQILRYGLVPDSGGPGRHRGGLAFARDYRVLGDSARMSIRSDRRDHPPHGLEGAGAGSPSTFVMNPGTTAERLLPAMPMEAIELRQGDVIHHASAGGGGMGDPFTRDPASVLTDVLDGKVSLDAARDRYGVVVAGGAVDVDLTFAAREGLSPPPSRVAGSRDAKPLCSHIEELETPVVTIDLDAVERNIERMQVYCDSHGLGLRAHVKTHKLPRIAAIQIDRGALSIVCQKLDEAEVMADAGVDRILLTYPLVGEAKWARAARLASRVRLSVIGDSLFIARGLASFLPPNGSVGFLVECDTGFARAGVQTPAEALELARAVTAIPEFRFDGLLTHPVPDAAQSWFAAAARLFADASIDLPTISVGGTPHARQVHERVPLATELRAGVYAYGDRACMLRGDHSLVDCAMRVRATVVSRPTANRVILDAGSKTLSSDLVKDTDDGLFGLVVEYPDLRLVALSEEHAHGELGRESPAPVLGEVVSIVPNHACAVSNLHDHVYLHRGAELPERVRVAARGGVR
jgi:D-serine deaminase-like pyridoxal phosphate-dependent protein